MLAITIELKEASLTEMGPLNILAPAVNVLVSLASMLASLKSLSVTMATEIRKVAL